MNRYDRLLALLKAQFPAATLQLVDNSAEHAGHVHGGTRVGDAKDGIKSPTHAHGQDGETHYILRIRDKGFAGLTRLQMHRKVIAAVQSEMDAGHAHGGARVGDARPALSAVEGDGIGSPMHSFVIEDCGT